MSAIDEMIKQLVDGLSIEGSSVEVDDGKDAVTIDLSVPEEASGVLIGFRGEKINALQLILTIMVNNDVIAYRPVHLDINGYRARREDNLRGMADAAAGNAVESGREILLPPLPPYERRIIHLHLETNDQVETYSEGEDRARRLVVRPLNK